MYHHPLISSVGAATDRAFALICHQIDSRSFHLMGYRLAVCGRCASIYFGFLAGILFWKIAMRKTPESYLIWWCCALLPMLLDVLCEAAGMHFGGNITRAVTGGWFGINAGVIITPLFIQGWREFSSPTNHQPQKAYESATE
jgi:uncharacterized membrane protein